jgi:hypothetical protein
MPSTPLQALLGYETLEMINIYVRLAEQDKRDIYVQSFGAFWPDFRQKRKIGLFVRVALNWLVVCLYGTGSVLRRRDVKHMLTSI